jgi:hypothetical protein
MKNKKHFYYKGKKASIIFSGMAKYDLSEICRICSDFLKRDQTYHRTTAGIVHVTCANNLRSEARGRSFHWRKRAVMV